MWFLLFLATPVFSTTCNGLFSQADRDVILAAHNKLRSSIALGKYTALDKTFPAASNMLEMEWNCDIENTAQAWANGCLFQHSNSKTSGENLYYYQSWTAVNVSFVPQRACDSWSNEFQESGLNSTTLTVAQFSAGIGHATQMAWALSNQLGCGVALCQNNLQALVVCQYQAKGNWLGSPIYLEGAACSACPSGATCSKDQGLCVAAA